MQNSLLFGVSISSLHDTILYAFHSFKHLAATFVSISVNQTGRHTPGSCPIPLDNGGKHYCFVQTLRARSLAINLATRTTCNNFGFIPANNLHYTYAYYIMQPAVTWCCDSVCSSPYVRLCLVREISLQTYSYTSMLYLYSIYLNVFFAVSFACIHRNSLVQPDETARLRHGHRRINDHHQPVWVAAAQVPRRERERRSDDGYWERPQQQPPQQVCRVLHAGKLHKCCIGLNV